MIELETVYYIKSYLAATYKLPFDQMHVFRDVSRDRLVLVIATPDDANVYYHAIGDAQDVDFVRDDGQETIIIRVPDGHELV